MNTSFYMNISIVCQIAEEFAQSEPLTVVQLCHITISCLALLALVLNLPLFCLPYKKLSVHLNLKLILINFSILYALNSIAFIITQTYNQYLYRFYTHSNPCELLFVRWKCLSYRGLSHFVYIGAAFTQFGVVYERAYASLYPSKYEACSGKIGIMTIVITWMAIVCGMYYLLYDEQWEALVPYCVITDWKTNERIKYQYMVILGVDITVTIIHIFITLYNKNQVEKRFELLALDNLQRAYQYCRNLRTMSVFLPLSALHSCIFIIYTIAFTIARSQNYDNMQDLIIMVEYYSTIICFYCFLMPTVFFVIRKRLDSKKIDISSSKIQSEKYFKDLERHWKYQESKHERFGISKMVTLIKTRSTRRIGASQMYRDTN